MKNKMVLYNILIYLYNIIIIILYRYYSIYRSVTFLKKTKREKGKKGKKYYDGVSFLTYQNKRLLSIDKSHQPKNK